MGIALNDQDATDKNTSLQHGARTQEAFQNFMQMNGGNSERDMIQQRPLRLGSKLRGHPNGIMFKGPRSLPPFVQPGLG